MKQSVLVLVTLLVPMALPACGAYDAEHDEAPGVTRDSDAVSAASSATGDASASEPNLSPEQTVQRLVELARAGDWETYVDDFYGESHKFEGLAERRNAVVARFREQWADEVLAGLEALDGGPPEITDDGRRAVFSRNGEPSFSLFLGDDGRWTFHL